MGLGAPLILATLWGVFGSPKAPVPLHGWADAGFGIAWFGSGVAALALAGRAVPAIVIAAAYALNTLMLKLWPN